MSKSKKNNKMIKESKKHLRIMICLVLSLIFAASAVYADFYVVDPYSGDIISAEYDDKTKSTDNVGIVRISSNCSYSKTKGKYVFSDTSYSFTSNVCDGQFTMDEVTLTSESQNGFLVYKDGEKTEVPTGISINDPGTYAVRDIDDTLVMEFTIISDLSSDTYVYDVPNVYRVSSIKLNGEVISSGTNVINFDEEGKYEVALYNKISGRTEYLRFTVDRTAPELEIFGVTDGVARQAVSFGDTEEDSVLEVYRDGNSMTLSDEYKLAGSYKVIYSDKAGNASVYNFDIRLFFDISAWMAIGFVAALIIAAVAYMLYWRKHTRVG